MESILVALITGGLSLLGVFIANGRSSAAVDAKLDKQQAVMETKIDELTRKVQAHNNLVERTYRLEERTELQEEKIKVANHRIEDLEKVQGGLFNGTQSGGEGVCRGCIRGRESVS